MKIAIIGAGSIGLLCGGYLGKENTITMIPRRQEQSNLLRLSGITVVTEDNCFATKVNADDRVNCLNEQDLVIIAVKQYHLSGIISILKNMNKKIPLLFLQNGMGHIQILRELPNETILVGTVEHGALKINENTVRHNGIGKINIALYRGNLQIIEPVFNTDISSFSFQFQKNWEEMLVKKLMINALINPLTAIFRVKNGQLMTNSHYFSILKAYYNEIHSIFPFMDKHAVFTKVVKICQNTSANKSSMLSDILNDRKTEIDAILGYIIKKSKEENIPIPITWTFYQMVKGMEQERGE